MLQRVLVAVGLVAVLLVGTGGSAVAESIAFSVQSDGNGQLFRFDLMTGMFAAIGDVGFESIEGLALSPLTGVLFGADDATDQLITINTSTGAGTAVGPLGINFASGGLTFSQAGTLFLANLSLFTVDPQTGATTLIGSTGLGANVEGLGFIGNTLYALVDNDLFTLNTGTGAATFVGSTGLDDGGDPGMDSDGSTLWVIGDQQAGLFTLDPVTGAATLQFSVPGNFEGLAIQVQQVPLPASLTLLMLGAGASRWLLARRRRG